MGPVIVGKKLSRQFNHFFRVSDTPIPQKVSFSHTLSPSKPTQLTSTVNWPRLLSPAGSFPSKVSNIERPSVHWEPSALPTGLRDGQMTGRFSS